MTAISDALAQVQQVHENQLALADPVGAAWSAQLAWMQAVTAALANSSSAAPSASTPAVDTTAEQLAALQEQVATLTSTFQAIEQRLSALFSPAPTTPSQGAAA